MVKPKKCEVNIESGSDADVHVKSFHGNKSAALPTYFTQSPCPSNLGQMLRNHPELRVVLILFEFLHGDGGIACLSGGNTLGEITLGVCKLVIYIMTEKWEVTGTHCPLLRGKLGKSVEILVYAGGDVSVRKHFHLVMKRG